MKVLMIDDHPLILTAMQNVVRGLGDDVHVDGVETLVEARALLVDGHDIDLVLLDLFLGEQDGYGFLLELRAAHPGLPVVIVSASERPADMIRCIDGGAMGFVPKRATTEMLFEALMLVMAGGIYVPEMVSGLGGPDLPSVPDGQVYPGLPELSEPTLVDAIGAAEPGGWGARRAVPALATGIPLGLLQAPPTRPVVGPGTLESLGLTPRQSEVLMLLLEGKANKVIAREMGLSVETVKDHVAAVLRCLGVASRMQAVVAVRHLLGPGGAGGRA